jgi:hypothetical protein
MFKKNRGVRNSQKIDIEVSPELDNIHQLDLELYKP